MNSQAGISSLVIPTFWVEVSNFKFFNLLLFSLSFGSIIVHSLLILNPKRKSTNTLDCDLNSVFSLSLLILHSLVIPKR